MNKKNIYKIHKWAGLTLGFFIFLLALSGVGITFRHELLPVVYESLFKISPAQNKLPLETLYSKAQSYLGEEKLITNLYASEHHDEAFLLLYKDPAKSFPVMLTLNPYTGEVVGEMGMIKNFFAIMLFMHSNFFLGNTGKYFVGFLGLVLSFFVISGVYIWYPATQTIKHKLKRSFSFPRLHLVQHLHHSFGLLFSVPLLISAITGSLIIFDISYLVMRPLTGQPEKIQEAVKVGKCTTEQQIETLRGISTDIANRLVSIHFCSTKNALMKVSYGLHDQNFLNGYGRLIIDPTTQERVQAFDSSTDPTSWNTVRLTVYPIHTGEYLGLFGRIVVLLGGISLMLMYLTGLTLTLKRRKVRQNATSTF